MLAGRFHLLRRVPSEQAGKRVSFARFQFFQPLYGFLGKTMRLAVGQEAVEGFLEREVRFLPLLTEHCFSQAFAGEFAGLEADKNDGFAVTAGDDGCFVPGIGNDHAAIVPVSS